jgi:hypothetical protein
MADLIGSLYLLRPNMVSSFNSSADVSWILEMPNELIDKIISDCDATVLHNLRLTCSTMLRISLRLFCRKYFTEYRVELTRKSLESLVEVTAHSEFAPCIRQITIGTCNLIGHSGTEIDGLTCVALLSKAFVNLDFSNNRVVFGIHDEHSETLQPFVQHAYGLGVRYNETRDTYHQPFLTLDIIRRSSLATGFRIDGARLNMSSKFGTLPQLMRMHTEYERLFFIAHSARYSTTGIHIQISGEKPALLKIHSHGKRLEISGQAFDGVAEYQAFYPYMHTDPQEHLTSMRCIIDQCSLEVVSIKDSLANPLKLGGFFRHNQTSLRSLELIDIHLVSEAGFDAVRDMFLVLKDETDLQTLILHDLHLRIGTNWYKNTKTVSRISLEGDVGIKSGLNDLMGANDTWKLVDGGDLSVKG